MKRKLVLAVTVIAAASAVSSIGYLVWLKNFSGAAMAQNAVRKALTDPDSAKFSSTFYNPKTGGACGLVNSKNRMGGYTGNTEFLVTKEGEVVIAESMERMESASATVVLEAAQRYLVFLKRQVAICNDPVPAKS